MNTAYWCVVVVMALPYIWAVAATLPGLTLAGNLQPRITAQSFTGWRQRAYWAHLNALETVAPFAATVIMAQLLGVPPEKINPLAIAFVGFRFAHAFAYMANLGVLRSLFWFGGAGCIVAMLVAAA